MRVVDLIRKKRDGGRLSPQELTWLIEGLKGNWVADYQWAALLMAMLLRGLDLDETIALTEAMLRSGQVVDLSRIPGPKVDKHSTGGVGDKTSMVLGPIAAAAGVRVPMISGRGLGHAGGTLDKLEAIPGLRTDLDLKAFRDVLGQCGLVMIGATDDLAPADRTLYALRDATATVESIPLITASILSKKVAEGIEGLVLDVKLGSGAYMRQEGDAYRLAESLCRVGRGLGLRVVALITDMNQPLGHAVGNANEVTEAIACLRGQGPSDLEELSLELAQHMIRIGGLAHGRNEALQICQETIRDGSALAVLRRMIELQGGDPLVVDEPSRLPQPERFVEVVSTQAGSIQAIDTFTLGSTIMSLGAGRARADHDIDRRIGFEVHCKVGTRVEVGTVLGTLGLVKESIAEPAVQAILEAFQIKERPVDPSPLIRDRLL